MKYWMVSQEPFEVFGRAEQTGSNDIALDIGRFPRIVGRDRSLKFGSKPEGVLVCVLAIYIASAQPPNGGGHTPTASACALTR
jgi:hypothetical protein